VLRRIFGSKREKVARSWKRMNNKEVYNLYDSPNIIRTIKSRRMKWVGHIARFGGMGNYTKFLLGIRERRKLHENIGIGGRIILKWILGK